MLDAQNAWAANEGDEVLQAHNGGQHWQRRSVLGFDVYGKLQDVDFANASVGWVGSTNDYFGVSDGRIARTVNGGASWPLWLSLPDAEFLGVAAMSPSTALAFGRGLFASSVLPRTANGGLTWNPITTAAGNFRGSYFLDASTGWLVGSRIHKTADGGASWRVEPIPRARGAHFECAEPGWVAGDAGIFKREGGTSCTPPSSYCTALMSFNGCTPAMSAAGSPSVSNPGGFNIAANSRETGQNGLLFFGTTGPAEAPFFEGGQSQSLALEARRAMRASRLQRHDLERDRAAAERDLLCAIDQAHSALGQAAEDLEVAQALAGGQSVDQERRLGAGFGAQPDVAGVVLEYRAHGRRVLGVAAQERLELGRLTGLGRVEDLAQDGPVAGFGHGRRVGALR